jgi:ABC-2 type transport system permease protein
MNALEIARVNLVRLMRDRSGLFFVFLLPVVLILVLGIQFGGRTAPRVGIVSVDAGPLGTELADAIGTGDVKLERKILGSEAELRDRVERGTVELGVLIPPGYDATLRGGGQATVTIFGRASTGTTAVKTAVEAAVAAQSGRVQAARFAVSEGAPGFDAALGTADRVGATLPGLAVRVESVGETLFPESLGRFSLGAQSQLVLFMFLTSMTAATQLIITRLLGISRRMLATPNSIRTIVVGEALGRFGVAMVQGLFILALSAIVFGVSWGDPLASGALIVAFALVGTGAAMFIGTISGNADQAGAFGVFAGMALGALGGSMVPMEVFPATMRTIAHLTPHAWAIDGFREVAVRGGGLLDILPELAVLLGMAGVLLAVSTWRFQRALTS